MIRRLLPLVLVAALLAAAGWWFSRPKPLQVVVHELARGSVEATVSNTRAGEVQACLRTKMSTIAGGRIEYLGVKEGDRVEKGQVLMRLWNDDVGARLNVNNAQIETARRRVREACTAADNAETEAARQVALRAKGYVSASAEERALTEARTRRAACDTAQADVATAEATARATETDRQRTVLVAPFAGTVAKITGELGEYSTPSPPGVPTPPAIDLIDDSCLYVSAPMDEVDAPKIQHGQVARISIDALPGKRFEGRVRRVAPYITAVEKQARTVEVEVDFDNPDQAHGLLVGYSSDVEILLDRRDDVPRVPAAALREGDRALVLGADGRIEERRVRTGLANWEYAEVLEGLAPGERVITSLERPGVKAGALAQVEAAR